MYETYFALLHDCYKAPRTVQPATEILFCKEEKKIQMKVNFSLTHPRVVFIGGMLWLQPRATLGRAVLPGNALRHNGKAEEKPLLVSTSPGRWLGLPLHNSISSSTANIASYGQLRSILRILDLKLQSTHRVFLKFHAFFSNFLDKIQRGGDSRSKERVFFPGTTPCKQELPWAMVVAEVKTQPDHGGRQRARQAPLRWGLSPRTPAGRNDRGTFTLPRQSARWSSPWG